MTLRYRADIDGLRAVAVAAVILYHFRVPGFGGGFVGVDVFFVISGFLISSLIVRDLEEQQFSLLHFYERRVRRILPALVVLLFAVSLVAFFELFPAAYLRFGQSVAATSVFLSNVEFWREVDTYFGSPASEKPLLHTWSLAVEEQFYLLFPPLLMLLAHRPKSWTIAAFATLVAVSFGIGAWTVFAAPQAGFFLFPARVWELLLGALIAVGAFPIASSRRLNTMFAASGMAMIAWAVTFYSQFTAFPVAALLPCIGAGLIIYAGIHDTSAITRLLSLRPIVFVGLISYSLYLWHWPIYIFAIYHLARDLTPLESASLIAASFAVATLSWRFVEQPFRRPDGVLPRRRLFIQAAAIMAVLGASGAAVYLSNGLPQRFTPEVQAALAPQTYFRRLECDPGQSEQAITGIELCKLGRPGGAATFFAWGDSHALVLLPAINRAADRFGRSGLMSAIGACPPFIGSTFPLSQRCLEHNAATYALLQALKIKDVILIGRWAGYAEYSDYIRNIHTNEVRSPALTIQPGWSLQDTEHAFAREFDGTVATLRGMGIRVTIVGPVPEIGMNVPMTLARVRLWNLPEDFGPTRAEFEHRNKTILDLLASEDRAVRLIYPDKVLCDQINCAVTRDGKPIYFDDHHLDRFGAESISTIFEPFFADPQ